MTEDKEKVNATSSSKSAKYIIVGVVSVLAVVGAFILFNGSKKDEQNKNNEEKIDGTNLSLNAVELECTDAKYGVSKGYQTIDALNYDFDASTKYAKDKDGNMIIIAQWNGKREDDGSKVVFQCYVSGSDDDNLVVHHISASGKNVWKDIENVDAVVQDD